MKTMFIIYELGHVDELKKYFEKQPEKKNSALVVALSIDIEEKLAKSHIPFISAGAYKTVFLDQLSNEDLMMELFFSDHNWNEFVYHDISLPKIFQFMFRAYVQTVRYYGMLLARIIEAHPDILEIELFPQSEIITNTYGTLASREVCVVLDCVKRIGEIRNIPVTILPPVIITAKLRNSIRPVIFSVKRSLFGILINIWNILVTFIIQPRQKRFLVSDHWKNIASSAKMLTGSELIFLDRTEIRNINFRLLLRYRMRFVHIADFLSKEVHERIKNDSKKFLSTWKEIKNDIPNIFSWGGYSFDPLLIAAMEDIVLDFPRILNEIEGTYALYREVQPHVVELRASVSKQTHFSILPLVAKRCGIPSLELQHGLEYLGPGSWSRNHEAEYIAVYGKIVKNELMKLGYESSKLPIVGSPRFDENLLRPIIHEEKKNKNAPKKTYTVLCVSPDIRAYEIYDSYSASDYFTAIASALAPKKEHVHIIVKLRPGASQEGILSLIIKRAFDGFSYRITHTQTLRELCEETDVAISCFSTAVLEILQYNIPVVLPALHPIDAKIIDFHFPPYEEAGALSIAHTIEALREHLFLYLDDEEKIKERRQKIASFMANSFSFDGKSSERYTALMNQLAENNHTTL